MKYFVNIYGNIFFLDAVAGRQEPAGICIVFLIKEMLENLGMTRTVVHADIFLVFLR